MIFALFLLLERIKKPIGEANYLPRLTGINLTQLISKNSFCVIIYTNNFNTRFDFINFAITKFSSHIKFAIASLNESIAPRLLNHKNHNFVIVPYKNGQKVETVSAPKTAIEFANWCEKITRPSVLRINHIDQLRRILGEPGTVLFGVNMISKPVYIKDSNIPFYSINQTYFQYLGISVNTGLYVYRSSDRQLIKSGENYKKFIKSPLADFSLLYITSSNEIEDQEINSTSKYFGGFFVDRENINETSIEATTLIKLSNKYRTIKFGLIEGETADKLSLLSQLQFIKRPFFVLFNINDINTNQLQNHYITFSKDVKSIEQFINNILEGKQDFTKISGKNSKVDLCYNSIESVISDNQNNDVLVLFSESLHSYSSKFLYFLAEESIKLINSKSSPQNKIELYRYDLSQNDIPNVLQISSENNNNNRNQLRNLVLYPKGKEKSELYFDSDESIGSMIDFILSGISFKCEIPEFDEAEIMKEINDRVKPKFVGFKKNLEEERNRREKGESESSDDSL